MKLVPMLYVYATHALFPATKFHVTLLFLP